MGAPPPLSQATRHPQKCEVYHKRHADMKLVYVVALRYNSANNKRKEKMSDFSTWEKYPFTVDGVEFLSLINPEGSMYKTIRNLPTALFAQMNEGAIRSIIGSVSTLTRSEIQAELDRVNENYSQAFLALA